MPADRRAIGIDAHVITGKFQGTRSTLTSLLRALAAKPRDRPITVYTEDPGEAAATIGGSGLRFVQLPHQGSLRRLLSVFPRLFRRDGIATGVFQYIAPLSGRHIVFVHDILPISHPRYFPWRNRLRTRIFYGISVRRAAMVIAVSEDTRRHLERHYRLPPARLRTILNGPSFPGEAYRSTAEPAAERYILTVGRIEERKNIPLLIEAFRRARPAGVKLLIVGAFDLDFHFEMPDDPAIEARQGISDEQLIGLYRGASLFVYPSAAEGFGMPLLDATLFGLPVISSDRTAMPEVGGALVRYFDPEAADAADRLAALIAGHFGADPVPRPTVAERARQAERFSWDSAADRLIEAIDLADRG